MTDLSPLTGDDLGTFPVEQDDIRLLKPAVSLAQKIDKTHHKDVKKSTQEDWFSKMAKEAELGSSDSG